MLLLSTQAVVHQTLHMHWLLHKTTTMLTNTVRQTTNSAVTETVWSFVYVCIVSSSSTIPGAQILLLVTSACCSDIFE